MFFVYAILIQVSLVLSERLSKQVCGVSEASEAPISARCNDPSWVDPRGNILAHTLKEDAWAYFVFQTQIGKHDCHDLVREIAEFCLAPIDGHFAEKEFKNEIYNGSGDENAAYKRYLRTLEQGQKDLCASIAGGADCADVLIAPLHKSTHFHHLKSAMICHSDECWKARDWYTACRHKEGNEKEPKQGNKKEPKQEIKKEPKRRNWATGKGRLDISKKPGALSAKELWGNNFTKIGGNTFEDCSLAPMRAMFTVQIEHGRGIHRRDPDGEISQTYEKCGVPWIGGLSGTIASILSFSHGSLGRAMDDKSLLLLMAQFVIGGHHSLVETGVVAKHYAEWFGKAPLIANLQPPFTADSDCLCSDHGCYLAFLKSLCVVAEEVFSTKGCMEALEQAVPKGRANAKT